MNNIEIKKIAQNALENEYGFAPSLKNIVLLESCSDGSYILFRVNNQKYRVYNGAVDEKLTGNEKEISENRDFWFNRYFQEHEKETAHIRKCKEEFFVDRIIKMRALNAYGIQT